QGRREIGFGRVLPDLRGVGLVDRLPRVASGGRGFLPAKRPCKAAGKNQEHYQLRAAHTVHGPLLGGKRIGDSNPIGRAESGFAIQRTYSTATKAMQMGEGTLSASPVAASFPVAGSIRNSTMEFEFWFSASRNLPEGSMAKWRGSLPPVGTSSTCVSVPS